MLDKLSIKIQSGELVEASVPRHHLRQPIDGRAGVLRAMVYQSTAGGLLRVVQPIQPEADIRVVQKL